MRILTAADIDGLRVPLAEQRKAMGLSQLQVDELARLPPGYTCRLEAGQKRYGPASLRRTLKVLGVALAIVVRAGDGVEANHMEQGPRRPLDRDGERWCTKGEHYAPHAEFATNSSGRLASWCKTCKREHDRVTLAEKRARRRGTA